MSLAFDRSGPPGKTVLLLHGIGGGRAIWASTLDALALAGFDVIAVDLPGYGDSQETAPGGVEHMAECVIGMLDELRLPSVALVGHSMGGMVAQEIAGIAQQRLSALVLACTSPAFGKPDGKWQEGFVAQRLAPLDQGLGMLGLAARLVPSMTGPHADPVGLALAQQVMAAVPEATYRRVLAAIAAFDRRASLAQISLPTLCLAAGLDQTAPPELMRRMAERIAGAEFLEIADAGHIANVEQPQAFNQALAGFLNRVLIRVSRPAQRKLPVCPSE